VSEERERETNDDVLTRRMRFWRGEMSWRSLSTSWTDLGLNALQLRIRQKAFSESCPRATGGI